MLVTLTESIVVVAEFAGEWEEPTKFRLTPRRVGVLHWTHVPENELLNALAALIKGARAARHSRYQMCEICEKRTPPEWMHDTGICLSCAADRGGAVH